MAAKLTGLATRDTPDDNLASISARLRASQSRPNDRGRRASHRAPPPELKVLDDSTRRRHRTVKMHIASARKASIVWMSVPVGVTVIGSAVDGKSPGDRLTDGWSGWYWGAPADGFDLTLKLQRPRRSS